MGSLSYSHDGVTIAVAFDRYVFGERAAWRWTIRETDGATLAEGTDLETPEYDMPGALVSLHSFLGAWAEAGGDGENAGLFPDELADKLDWSSWCDYAHSDLHPGEWLS